MTRAIFRRVIRAGALAVAAQSSEAVTITQADALGGETRASLILARADAESVRDALDSFLASTAALDLARRPPAGRLCYETTAAGFPVRLFQRGKDNFGVQYGLQVDDRLTYADAAAKLGQALMHALACESRLDNRTRDER